MVAGLPSRSDLTDLCAGTASVEHGLNLWGRGGKEAAFPESWPEVEVEGRHSQSREPLAPTTGWPTSEERSDVCFTGRCACGSQHLVLG